MPHLKYGKRYWRISSDELWLPGFCSAVGRFFWLILVVICISFSAYRLSTCEYGGLILFYLTISCLLFIAAIVSDAFIIKTSIQGTIVDNSEREEAMPQYLTIKICLGTCQFLAAIFGCIVISSQISLPCAKQFKYARSNIDVVFLGIIVISQIIESSILLCCCFLFSASRVTPDDEDVQEDVQENIDVTSLWKQRMKFICRSVQICSCNIFGILIDPFKLYVVSK
jgi:hypothetical protein